MLLDTQNIFSDAQAITSGTIDSESVIKFGKGDISYLPLLIQAVSDFSNLDSLTVKILTSADETFTSSVTLAESTLALADLKAGATFPLSHIPKGNLGYMKLTYTVEGSSTETTGKITAGIVPALDIQYKP